MSENGHDLDNEWKLPLFLLLGVGACIGLAGMILIYIASPG